MKKTKILAVFVTFFLVAVFFPKVGCVSVHKNISESLPHTYFLGVFKGKEFKKGQFVKFNHSLSSIPLVKKVIGLAGDEVLVEGKKVLVNGDFVGEVLDFSPSGMPLSPIEGGVIPDGHMFVMAYHAMSFDSRYQEFGLVPYSCIEEVLWPIY